MAKKNFDTFLNSVNPSKPSPAEIEAMTRELHQRGPDAPRPDKSPAAPRPPRAPKAASAAEAVRPEAGRRGRKPRPAEAERMIRVSVDLPESVFIALGATCVRQKTDKKTYIRHLVEKTLKG